MGALYLMFVLLSFIFLCSSIADTQGHDLEVNRRDDDPLSALSVFDFCRHNWAIKTQKVGHGSIG